MKKLTLLLIFLFALSANAFATGQAPDVLLYDGKVYDLFSNPLEAFYKNEKDRPKFFSSPNGGSSSANWRGYVAYWEIEADSLNLKAIDSWLCEGKAWETAVGRGDCNKADVKKLFGNGYAQNKVFADWFSGELRIPDGKQLQYVHMGYGSVYERDILISVKQGKIIEKKIIDNTTQKPESETELQRRELEKLKKSPLGNKKIS
ncbi:MAG TPA: hypothetical protein VK400_14555 [Pyrinomonadaceae bacterium]|nr:hypothetical protein [Pyrinomonadaceae bacterium]